jgi:branched-chain amino acid transport system substrate-binding protein
MQHFDAVIDPVSHHVQQTIYLCGRNDKPVDKTDYFKIISMATPEEARDQNEQRDCKLQAYNDTPSYEQ